MFFHVCTQHRKCKLFSVFFICKLPNDDIKITYFKCSNYWGYFEYCLQNTAGICLMGIRQKCLSAMETECLGNDCCWRKLQNAHLLDYDKTSKWLPAASTQSIRILIEVNEFSINFIINLQTNIKSCVVIY